jgi:hypothetical protein
MQSGKYTEAEEYFRAVRDEAKTPGEREQAAIGACEAAYKSHESMRLDPGRYRQFTADCSGVPASKLPVDVVDALCEWSYQEQATKVRSPADSFDVAELQSCRNASTSMLDGLREKYLEFILDRANAANDSGDGAELRAWGAVYSRLPGADQKKASELTNRARSLLNARAKEEAKQAAAEAPVRNSAKVALCAALLGGVPGRIGIWCWAQIPGLVKGRCDQKRVIATRT